MISDLPSFACDDEPQWEEAFDALRGARPLAIIEKRKAPRTYTWLRRNLNEYEEIYNAYVIPAIDEEGEVVYVGEIGAIENLRDALKNRKDRTRFPTRESFQRHIGSLLGYDPQSVNEFIYKVWPEILCECSKCGGPFEYDITPRTRITYDREIVKDRQSARRHRQIEHDAYLARTAYHSA